MYGLARHLHRDDLEAIGARCYLELLHGGYTAVAEFLYLHRCGERTALDAASLRSHASPLTRSVTTKTDCTGPSIAG